MSLKIITTDDGSHSLYNEELKETYHSSHGALTESRHVFIKNGLAYFSEKFPEEALKIFEIGFGTGLNALLAWKWASENQKKVIYHSIEQFPLQPDMVKDINYGRIVGEDVKFSTLHNTPWNNEEELSSIFVLKKINAVWQNYKLDQSYNIIFYDAFAPSKQPEMWEKALLQKCIDGLQPQGIITTYCARGQLKRDLASLGFEVQTLPGPPGKKEMVRGILQ